MSENTKTIIQWIAIVLLGLQFAAASLGKLTGAAEEAFINWGYNATFMYVIGIFEGLGAIGVFIPTLRKWAAFGLISIMVGAAYTHIVNDELIRLLHNAIIIAFALTVVFTSKKG